ncbi:MAG: N-acetylglucosamine-6-phosphate deacetylase [Sphingopyxis sp.]|nr:N-acetylglucosamine-6-phosphate deacetylase [Sphingopyxis sp.]
MRFAITNGSVFAGDRMPEGAAVVVAGARIEAIVRAADLDPAIERVDLAGATLAPGFIDVQVNGGGGALFNDDPSVETLRIIAAAHRRFGTTALLPTLISDSIPKIREAVQAVDAAIAAGVPGIAGIHIEGPFLNVERKGTHDANAIRALDDEGFAAITGLRHGKTLVTLAPEVNDAQRIAALRQRGVIIAAGHTNATFAQMERAFAAGVTGVTHLFNAMSQITPREPGVVGAALTDPACWCGIIVDGFHVDPVALRLAIKAKGSLDRFLLVSDAMPPVGHDSKAFDLNGETIVAAGGVCRRADGTLAGADLDMAAAVRNAAAMLGLTRGEAIRLATQNPAQFAGLDAEMGSIAPGLRANLVALDDGGQVLRTWIDGQEA